MMMMMMMMMIKIAMMRSDDDEDENNNAEVDDDCECRDDHNAFTQSITQINWKRIRDPCKLCQIADE